jgi:hypothetical protein
MSMLRLAGHRLYEGNPIVKPVDPASVGVFGPGHHSLWQDKTTGRVWVFYHQKRTSEIGWDRFLCVDELEISDAGILSVFVTRSPIQLPALEL